MSENQQKKGEKKINKTTKEWGTNQLSFVLGSEKSSQSFILDVYFSSNNTIKMCLIQLFPTVAE